jgi:rubrerythrin
MGKKPVGRDSDRSTRGVSVLDEARGLDPGDGDFVEFVSTGAAVAGAFHCSGCGYGVTISSTLPRCPMCSGTTWEAASSGRPLQ